VLLLILAACASLSGSFDDPADPNDTAETVVTVPKGATPRTLGPVLEQAGIIDSAGSFTWYARLSKEGACMKAGRFRLSRSMSPHEILTALCGAPIPEDVPFTVVEGWRIRDIDEALVTARLIAPGAYIAAAADPSSYKASFTLPSGSLEGYLYPETYRVEPDRFDVHALVQRQLDLFGERFATPYASELGGRGLAAIVTMASLLEREEPKPENRPLVAGILWKRIDNGWALGVDATSRYGLAQWNDRQAFLVKLRDPDDPYNTRLRMGLPPTPIGNPNLSSLLAALHPVDSEYWYYLHDQAQNLHPSRNEAEHEAFRKKFGIY